MRNTMIPTSPAPRQRRGSTGPDTMRSPSGFNRAVKSPSDDGNKTMDTARMFELFENKAEVQILNSTEDDRLAAAMYGGVKKNKRKKSKKQKKGVSGYDFDSLIKDESSSSSSYDFH
eukprot:CAMPEP_0116134688 /NCGR_PEP_ID=MMETSP0329-20121206/10784_1 /TAXON_ID=697910 /ORGANISM="Pseudo-nitzschia arenysensis, Strain B593" /LENGTH=116 /DNA_ID=CAMNT_0003629425 /DNA_START=56 /DNA_END=406 /DNA_ORIENTATION=-